MPKIDKKDILGYEADNDFYCSICGENKGKDNEVEHNKLLTADSMERDQVYYCISCHKKIGGNGSSSGGGMF